MPKTVKPITHSGLFGSGRSGDRCPGGVAHWCRALLWFSTATSGGELIDEAEAFV